MPDTKTNVQPRFRVGESVYFAGVPDWRRGKVTYISSCAGDHRYGVTMRDGKLYRRRESELRRRKPERE